jgi:hypothetical protein
VAEGELERVEQGLVGVEDDVTVVRSGGILILEGPQSVVDRLIAGDPALRAARRVHPSSAAALGALASLAPLVGSVGGSSQTVFQLNATGQALFESGALSSAGDGFYRLFGQGPGGKIIAHGALKPMSMAPQQAISAQLAIMTIALTAAIKEVQQAVERVEAKVDLLRDLVEAVREGEIIGANRTLRRRADQLGFDGAMSDADWHSIVDLGVQVEQQIEQLRSYIRKRVAAAEDQGRKISGRLDAVEIAKDVSETLALLIVAQDSLFLFQQLRVLRIMDTEPEHAPAAIDESRALLDQHFTEDADLVDRLRTLVAERVEVQALEMLHFVAAGTIVRLAPQVDESLAWFASQRGVPYEAILVPDLPTASEVVDEARVRGAAIASEGKRIFGGLTDRVRNRDGDDESRSELGPGQATPALPAETGTPETDDPDRVMGRVARLRSQAVSRLHCEGDADASSSGSATPEATD